jgi:hypothetical protein
MLHQNGLAWVTYIGWQGIRMGWWQPCLRLELELILPMEHDELAPCGWHYRHRRPSVTGSIGNVVVLVDVKVAAHVPSSRMT